MKNIKAFLEADALRTQGEWVARKSAKIPRENIFDSYAIVDAELNDGMRDICRSIFTQPEDYKNADFIALSSYIAPEIRAMHDAFKQVCEALEIYRAHDEKMGMMGAEACQALDIAAPYREPYREMAKRY